MAKSVYEMKLHEEIRVFTTNEWDGETRYYITRVPGGWIYQYNATSTFVPYSDELKETV